MPKIQQIGLLTSGGDAPGMNAAIRAVVRTAIHYGLKVKGIRRGYAGLINNDIIEMNSKSVGNIIQLGGTILRTARSDEFMTVEGRRTAYENLVKKNIDALVVIGGDGTLKGARKFADEHNLPVVGIPGTIDNDLFGTDMTIGYDTAINTVVQAVDKIRDTAASHERLFFVEVMGKDAGFIATRSAIACGAEAVIVPEVPTNLKKIYDKLLYYLKEKKTSSIVLVAEGDTEGGAFEVQKKMEKFGSDFEMKVTVLGHIQRGGSPTAYDRYLASRIGISAVEALLEDQRSIMIGMINRDISHISFNKTIKYHKDINRTFLEMVDILNS